MHLFNVLKILLLLNLITLLQTQSIKQSSTITLKPNELPNCSISKHSERKQLNHSNRELVIVSTIDGKITAIDTSDGGKILWSKETGQILTSTIHQLKFTYKGSKIDIVQSLDGMLYAIKDKKVKKIPLNAENFLKHSLKISKDIVITGGKEKRTFGFNLETGEIQYECGLEGCKSTNSGFGAILLALKESQTLRGIDPRTGSEKFNYTVGDIDLSLVTQEGDCAGFINNTMLTDSLLPYEMKYKVSKIDSKVMAYDMEETLVWSHVLKAPIIKMWVFKKGVLRPLNLFDNSIAANNDVPKSPTYYIGSYKQNFYIQLPQDSTALDIYQPSEADLFSYHISEVSFQDKVKQHNKNAIMSLDQEDYVYGAYFYDHLEDIKEDENTTICKDTIINAYSNNTEIVWPIMGIGFTILLIWAIKNVYQYCSSRTFEMQNKEHFLQVSKSNSNNTLSPRKRSNSKPSRKRTKSSSKETLISEKIIGLKNKICVTHRKRTKSEDMNKGKVKSNFEKSDLNAANTNDAANIKEVAYTMESDSSIETGVNKEDTKKDVSLFIESDDSMNTGDENYGKSLNLSSKESYETEDSHEDNESSIENSDDSFSENGEEIEGPEPSDSSFVIEFQSNSFKAASKHSISKSPTSRKHSPRKKNPKKQTDTLPILEKPQFSRFFSDFNDFHRLGQGGFGLVFRAYKNLIGKHYAIKVIKFPENVKRQEKIIRELKLLGNLEHKRIVRYYDGWVETHDEQQVVEKLREIPCDNTDNYEPTFFNTASTRGVLDVNTNLNLSLLFIQMELCKENSLNDWLLDSKSRDPQVALDYFYQIVEAVQFIHQNNIIHRDIKPSNIFLSQENTIKLGDFGLARDLTELSHLPTHEMNKVRTGEQLTQDIGTWYYLSPELIQNQPYNEKADIFSLGIVFMEISTSTNTVFQKEEKLINFRNHDIIPEDIVDIHKIDLLKQLTAKDQNQRPSAKEIMQHKVFQDLKTKHISLTIT